VETFSELGPKDLSKQLAILPYDEEKFDSLEWKSYAKKLASRFEKNGVEVSDPRDAQLIAFFGYAIDEGERVTTTHTVPEYGVTGYSSSYTTGTLNSYGNSTNFNATTTYQPEYGITGYSQETTTRTVYTRSLAIDIVDKSSGEKKWQARLTSRGKCGRISEVIDELIQASLTNFPESTSETVEIEGDFDC
jgi:hypothetical protein